MSVSETKANAVTEEVSKWGELFGASGATVRETIDGHAARIRELSEQKGKPALKIEGLTQVAQECLGLIETLQGKMIDKDVLLLDVKGKCDKAMTGHATIHKITSRVLLPMTPFLQGLKVPEAKDGAAAAPALISIDQSVLSHTIESIEDLNKYLEEHRIASATPVKSTKVKKENHPNVLPDTAALATKLVALHEELNKLMQGVNPKTDIEALKVQYAAKKQEFDDLVKSHAVLVRPVNRILENIEGQVKTFNEQQIPLDAIKYCAIAQRKTEKEVMDELAGRKEVNDARIARHDALAKAWTSVLIEKEAIEWELKRIEMYANIFTDIDRLNTKLSGLEGSIESCKAILRSQAPLLKYKPEDLKNLLESSLKTLNGLYEVYGECALLGTQHRPNADISLKTLTDLQVKGGKDLTDALDKIQLFDAEAKKAILANAAKSVAILQIERQDLFLKLQSQWKSVYERLDLCDNQKSLTYELVRACYVCEKNSGILPTDSFYKAKLFGWVPEREPVKSPWTPVVEEKPKVEEKKTEEKPKVEDKKEEPKVEDKKEAVEGKKQAPAQAPAAPEEAKK